MQLHNTEVTLESQTYEEEEYEDAKMVDLVFLMDSTGSMGSYIESAKRNIVKIAGEIQQSEKISAEDLRMCVIAYRDHPPQDKTFVTRQFPFTSDPMAIRGNLSTLRASGGGDGPEAVTAAMHVALSLKWRPNAAKIIVLIADAPPHGIGEEDDGFPNGDPNGHDPLEIARLMAGKGIVIYPVACEPTLSTSYLHATDFFKSLADITGGLMVPLTSATQLTKVIVGGAQEQLDLEKLVKELGQKAAQKVAQGKTEEEVTMEVHKELEDRGAKTRQLNVDNIYEDNKDAEYNVAIWTSAQTLAEARTQVKKVSKSRLKSSYSSSHMGSRSARRRIRISSDEEDAAEEKQNVNVSNESVSVQQVKRLVKQSVSRRWDE